MASAGSRETTAPVATVRILTVLEYWGQPNATRVPSLVIARGALFGPERATVVPLSRFMSCHAPLAPKTTHFPLSDDMNETEVTLAMNPDWALANVAVPPAFVVKSTKPDPAVRSSWTPEGATLRRVAVTRSRSIRTMLVGT